MKKIHTPYILLLTSCIFLLFVSCRKEPLDFYNPNSRNCNSFEQQFQAVWDGMDQSYMFWERDTVDWDARYEQFLPVFQEFDSRRSNNPVTSDEYQKAWKGVFEGILDHHLTARIWCPKYGGYEAFVQPAKNAYEHWTDRNSQISALRNQPGISHYLACDPTGEYVPGSWFCLLPGKTPDKKIAYFRFTNFGFMKMYEYREALDNKVTAQAPVIAFYGPRYNEGMVGGEACYANNDSVEALIIDVRGNGGGNLHDIPPLIGSLSQNNVQLGYTRVKEGMGRLDYSGWTPFVIKSADLHINKSKPIVVLADINSASCAELTTLFIKYLPNGTFIGERTYGATCALWPQSRVMHDIFYNGCFGDDFYWENGYPYNKKIFSYFVYTSSFDMVDRDYFSLEGKGVTPDIEVLYDASQLRRGIDTQLERALSFLRTGK